MLLAWGTAGVALLPGEARAQGGHGAPVARDDASVSAEVDRAVVEIGDTFEYTLEAATFGSQEIRVVEEPDFKAFSLVGRSQMPQLLVRNGVAERRLRLVYTLRARRLSNKLVIAPPVVAFGSEQRSPEAISIKVVKKGQAPAQHKVVVKEDAVYVDASTSLDRDPYVGEQIVLQYDLYIDSRRIEAQPRPPSEPSLDAFWIEELDDIPIGSRQIIRLGKRFFDKILLRRYAIFPLQAGEVTIEAMSVPLTTSGFMRSRQSVTVESKPLTLQVRPLPEGAPQGFYEGNVGDWDFLVTSDALRARVGRAVTIRISARGDGQAGRIQLPDLSQALEDVQLGDVEQSVEQSARQGKLYGEKLATYALTPLKEGTLIIPALSFTYFDPEEGEYHTKQSAPIAIEVGSGELPPEPLERVPSEQARQRAGGEDVMSALRSELRGLGGREFILSQESSGDVTERAWFRALIALALLLAGALLAAPLARRWRARTSPSRRREAIYAESISKLAVAAESSSYEPISRAIKLYCAEALELPRGHITERELPGRLKALGANEQVAEALGALLGESERARYASSSSRGAEALAEEAEAQLAALHREMKRRSATKRRGAGASSAASALLAILAAGALLLTVAPEAMAAPPSSDSSSISVENAVAAHQAHDWDEALRQWEALRQRRPDQPDLLYALGTAALFDEDLGRGVWALERARWLSPSDQDVRHNLQVGERMVRVRAIEALRGRTQVLPGSDDFFWWEIASRLDPVTLALLLLIGALSVSVALLFRARLEHEVGRDLLGVIVALGVLMSLSAGAAWLGRAQVMQGTRPAILLSDEARFRDGPSEHAAERALNSPTVAGSRYLVQEQRRGWLKLKLPDGTSGWIERDQIGLVVPE